MTLAAFNNLISENRLSDLESAWKESLSSPGPVQDYAKTLEALCDQDLATNALALCNELIEALVGAGRHRDALAAGMTLVRRDAHDNALGHRLLALIREAYGSEPWFPTLQEMAGLDAPDGAGVSAEAMLTFDRMRRYTPGHVIYHRAGWGEGLVEDFDPHQQELTIRFASGLTKEISLNAATESMTPLEPDDLRTMLLTAKDELERLAAEEPSLLIRKAVKIFRGHATSSEIKSVLCPAVIPTKKWASFWKRAKAAAVLDPWLQVEGSKTRPTFELRKRPLDLVEEARMALRHSNDLGEEIAQIRGYLERCADDQTRSAILDIAQERVEAAAKDGKASHADILDGILLLEKHSQHPSASAGAELRAMLLDEKGELNPENFDLLATQEAREHAVGLLPEALGENWVEQSIAKATRFPVSVVERFVNLLTERGHAAALAPLWDQIAPYPQRHPALTYLYARAYADGAFDALENKPDRIAVARVLLHLARVLATGKRDPWRSRLMTRVASLLTGRRKFLQGVFDDIDRDNLKTFLGICERGGSQFPQEITACVLRAVANKYPDLTATPEKPFWEKDVILVTREGLARRREEYRRLVDEQIPTNSKAIGAAASLGDLSENSEWDAAMEEQRNLTEKAQNMDEELSRVAVLEEQQIPDGIVVPGTAVSYVEVATGVTHRLRILGPWDAVEDDVINYKAPFAASLLGKTPGETAHVPGEFGEIEVRIESVERIV